MNYKKVINCLNEIAIKELDGSPKCKCRLLPYQRKALNWYATDGKKRMNGSRKALKLFCQRNPTYHLTKGANNGKGSETF
jgi:hypothetical protein